MSPNRQADIFALLFLTGITLGALWIANRLGVDVMQSIQYALGL